VEDAEELVEGAAERVGCEWYHQGKAERADYAPNPIREFAFSGMRAVLDIFLKQPDGIISILGVNTLTEG
jgi:hypothetical protein